MKICRLTSYFIVSALILLLYSCEKYDRNIEGDVEVYLLQSYSMAANSSAILDEGIVLENDPVLRYSSFREYDSKSHTYKLTAAGAEAVKDLWGEAFAVTVDGEIIYTGYFWSSLSSAGVDWVVIDATMAGYNGEMKVSLGYPGKLDEWNIPDHRNDSRILSVFARDGKLVD